MEIIPKLSVERVIKKLAKQQKVELDAVLKILMDNPALGEAKTGDLSGIKVYKFKLNRQLTLLAYSYDEAAQILYLISLGSHENFYRDLKH